MKLLNRTKADPGEEAALAAEVEAARAEPMEVATVEATSEDAPVQVQVQLSSWQARVFYKPPPHSASASAQFCFSPFY